MGWKDKYKTRLSYKEEYCPFYSYPPEEKMNREEIKKALERLK